MSRPNLASLWLGKAVRFASRIRGNGSAIPGYIVERVNPGFIKFLSDLPRGVVVISGTNGKTTTTKIVTELLESAGLRVFTNDTGSNFVRGVISAAIPKVSMTGKFPYDIAVLELDEAHALKFVEQVKPTYSLLLNVARDQIDRFTDIEDVAKLLRALADATIKTVILNREDSRLAHIKVADARYFGLSDKLRAKFPRENSVVKNTTHARALEISKKHTAPVILAEYKDNLAEYHVGNKILRAKLKLKGIYNAYNAAAALALVHAILPDHHLVEFSKALSSVESAWGRGEEFELDGKQIEIFLIKNPAAFQLTIDSFVEPGYLYMIAINDAYADGRDITWLDTVDYSKLKSVAITSGSRADDMTQYLENDGVKTGYINPNLNEAFAEFLQQPDAKLRIFASYTAMLELRKIIKGKSLA